MTGQEDSAESLVAQAVRRRTGDRYAAAEHEVRRILDVGLALMREDPDGNPKIADIVRRAGVSNDAFYRAFRSKHDLMAAIVDDGSRRLLDYVRHQRDKADDPLGKIRACVVAVLQQAANPEVARTTRAVLRHTQGAPTSHAPTVLVRERIAELLAESLAERGSPDPARDAMVGACAAFSLMEQFLWTQRTPSDADVDHVVAWISRTGPGGSVSLS